MAVAKLCDGLLLHSWLLRNLQCAGMFHVKRSGVVRGSGLPARGSLLLAHDSLPACAWRGVGFRSGRMSVVGSLVLDCLHPLKKFAKGHTESEGDFLNDVDAGIFLTGFDSA